MKEHTLYFILLCLVTIVIYAGYMQATAYGQKRPKFNTTQVREMWQACSVNFQLKFPELPSMIRISLCDCYMDFMRTQYTHKQVKEMTPEESKEIGIIVRGICPIPSEFINPNLDDAT